MDNITWSYDKDKNNFVSNRGDILGFDEFVSRVNSLEEMIDKFIDNQEWYEFQLQKDE